MQSTERRCRGRPRDGHDKDGWKGMSAVNEALGYNLFSSPPRSMRQKHDPAQYRFEKVTGVRAPSGAKKLKKLNAKHRAIIKMHLECMSNRDISTVTGISEATVSQILRDPLSQEVIRGYIEGVDAELEALAPLAVDAVRTGLLDEEPRVRLQAADRFFKATGRYNQAEEKRETAEDVLARALSRVAAEVELRKLKREAPIHAVSHSRRGLLIEGHAEEVESDSS